MATHNSPRSIARLARGTEEGAILPPSSNNHDSIGRHSPVHTKLSDELREYLRDQPRLVLIGVNGVARPFFHLPFHTQEIARA